MCKFSYVGTMQIPRSALTLGLAGVLPFLWSTLTLLNPEFGQLAAGKIGGRFVGPHAQLAYGAVILSFMSGVLWGFATKAGDRQGLCYALSTLPALWAFFMVGGGVVAATSALIIGFVALLGLDWQFSQWKLTPPWWMKLRLLLTSLVVLCLASGFLYR